MYTRESRHILQAPVPVLSFQLTRDSTFPFVSRTLQEREEEELARNTTRKGKQLGHHHRAEQSEHPPLAVLPPAYLALLCAYSVCSIAAFGWDEKQAKMGQDMDIKKMKGKTENRDPKSKKQRSGLLAG